jgi:hypothetical protein
LESSSLGIGFETSFGFIFNGEREREREYNSNKNHLRRGDSFHSNTPTQILKPTKNNKIKKKKKKKKRRRRKGSPCTIRYILFEDSIVQHGARLSRYRASGETLNLHQPQQSLP